MHFRKKHKRVKAQKLHGEPLEKGTSKRTRRFSVKRWLAKAMESWKESDYR